MVLGMSALVGFVSLDTNKAAEIENRMYVESVKTGRISANEEKLSDPDLVEHVEE